LNFIAIFLCCTTASSTILNKKTVLVARAGVGQCNESGQGKEENTVMAADGHRQQSTKSGDGDGRCNSDSNDNKQAAAKETAAVVVATAVAAEMVATAVKL
jgi:hypothetical protein